MPARRNHHPLIAVSPLDNVLNVGLGIILLPTNYPFARRRLQAVTLGVEFLQTLSSFWKHTGSMQPVSAMIDHKALATGFRCASVYTYEHGRVTQVCTHQQHENPQRCDAVAHVDLCQLLLCKASWNWCSLGVNYKVRSAVVLQD